MLNTHTRMVITNTNKLRSQGVSSPVQLYLRLHLNTHASKRCITEGYYKEIIHLLVKNSSKGLKPKVIPTIAVTAEPASLSPNSTPPSRTMFSVISKINPVSENKEAPTFSPNSPVNSVPNLNLSVNKGTSAWGPLKNLFSKFSSKTIFFGVK